MKKVITLILALILILSLISCGKSNKGTQNTESNNQGTKAKELQTDNDKETQSNGDNEDKFAKYSVVTVNDADVVQDCEEIKLRLSHHVTENDSNHVYALAFKDAVEKLSGGKMEIEVYPNGQLFGQAEALAALQQNTLDIALSDTSLFANYDAAGSVFDLPYLIKTRDQAVKMSKDEKVLGFIRDTMSQKAKLRVLGILPIYFRSTLAKNTEIKSIEDFKGLIVRTPEAPHIIAAFKAFGANPTVIPSGEAYTSVQTGVAEALEGQPEYVYLQKFYEVAKNYIQTKHVFTFTAYSMSQERFDGLTDKQKDVINRAHELAHANFLEYTANVIAESEDKLKAENVTFTEVDLLPFQESVKSYVDDFLKKNNLQEIYEHIQTLID